MYTNAYYDRLDAAWSKYINALEDHEIPYSRVLELRAVYERIVKEPPDVNPCQ